MEVSLVLRVMVDVLMPLLSAVNSSDIVVVVGGRNKNKISVKKSAGDFNATRSSAKTELQQQQQKKQR